MSDKVMTVVGTSEVWEIYENKHGICHLCSGLGELATTNRASYYPEKYPDELKKCPDCDGKRHPKAIVLADNGDSSIRDEFKEPTKAFGASPISPDNNAD